MRRGRSSESGKTSLLRQLHKHLRDWLRFPLDQINKSMVVARYAELHAIPSGANHLLRQLRSIWNHARRTHDLPEAPALAMEWYPEEPDGRIIENLPEWCGVVNELESPIHAAYYRLLDLPRFCSGHLIASYAIQEDGHGIETQRGIST